MVIGRNPLPNLMEHDKTARTRNQEKHRFYDFSRKPRKTPNLPLFRVFAGLGRSVISDRERGWFQPKVVKMTRIKHQKPLVLGQKTVKKGLKNLIGLSKVVKKRSKSGILSKIIDFPCLESPLLAGCLAEMSEKCRNVSKWLKVVKMPEMTQKCQ